MICTVKFGSLTVGPVETIGAIAYWPKADNFWEKWLKIDLLNSYMLLNKVDDNTRLIERIIAENKTKRWRDIVTDIPNIYLNIIVTNGMLSSEEYHYGYLF